MDAMNHLDMCPEVGETLYAYIDRHTVNEVTELNFSSTYLHMRCMGDYTHSNGTNASGRHQWIQ